MIADPLQVARISLLKRQSAIRAKQEAEGILFERGVIIVPDFIAHAGGVICGAIEYRGGNESVAFPEIAERIRGNTSVVLERRRNEKILPRQAAVDLARDRVTAAMADGTKN